MLRDKSLIPLSHQHQHALALCVRIDRASPIPAGDVRAWQDEIVQHFRNEIGIHFAAEEKVLFPAACRFEAIAPLVGDLLAEHSLLRDGFREAESGSMSPDTLAVLAQRLAAHIRKEERLLFEQLQECMTSEELATLGPKLAFALQDATNACILPQAATQLRPREKK